MPHRITHPSHRFGITGATNLVLVVEARTDFTASPWLAVGTNRLIRGASFFSDPGWTNSPARFYRLRSP